MDHAAASALLARLHEAQNRFYAGGDSAPLRVMLTPDVTWTIPGSNAVAGTYRGIDAVLAYFERRRATLSPVPRR
jgi:ketosteroid isomerase-like protein